MQSRRHITVAVVMITVQILSLVVATDILGADVSDFATPAESIEAIGEEPEADAEDPEDAAEDEVALGFELPQPFELPELAELAATTTTTTTATTTTTTAAPATAVQTTSAPTTVAPTSTVPVTTSTTISVATTAALQTNEAASAVTPSSSTLALTEESTVPAVAAALTTSTTVPANEASNESSSTVAQSTTSAVATTVATGSATSAVAQSSSTVGQTTSSMVPATSTSTTTTTTLEPAASTTTTTIPVAAVVLTSTTTTLPTTTSSTTTTTTPTTSTSTSTTTTTSTTLPATVPTTTTTTTVPATNPPSGSSANNGLEAIRNNNGNFGRYASVPSASLSLNALTEPAPRQDNGSVGDGQFRAACEYSHFGYDDPIIYPNQPGRSHLHMFFGNTGTNANSNTNSLVNSGGGTCNGFELNRSAYWTPALLDGRGNVVVPDAIILYYKSKRPSEVQRMPQGLKMVAGNFQAESFNTSQYLFWSCGGSGAAYNKTNRIPNCNGDYLNATISFPQCWDGVNMDSADHKSHMALVSPHVACPSSHPVRLPQISILLYFPSDGYTGDWHLSSDRSGGFNSGPGATLHADWWGAWNDEAMDLWIQGCMRNARNCSFGQTGTDRQLAKLNNWQTYQGQNTLPLPS